MGSGAFYFGLCVNNLYQEKDPIRGNDAMNTFEVIFAADLSAAEGRTVTLEEIRNHG